MIDTVKDAILIVKICKNDMQSFATSSKFNNLYINKALIVIAMTQLK